MREEDILDQNIRKALISEIMGEENKRRKEESLKRFEVYRERQERFVLKKLREEFSEQTVHEMRKVFSINPTKRIVNEEASIYKTKPERNFSNVTQEQAELLNKLYNDIQANVQLKRSNRVFKLQNQAAIQVVPQDQKPTIRVLHPHQYDVIPRSDNPEKALAYVINTFDKTNYLLGDNRDNFNQGIADQDDYKKTLMRFVWWTDQYNFITDGHGAMVLDPERDINAQMLNPIGKLPFVDVAMEKDFEFWVRQGNGVVDFTIDFSVLLSDAATVNRNQGYAQAIFKSREKPESITLGPNHVLWLKLIGDTAENEDFSFANANPDLAATIELLEINLKLFLSSRGVDTSTIVGKGQAKSYSSGVERLLALMQRFEASADDLDLYQSIEQKLFKLIMLWNNAYQGTDLLSPEYQVGQIPEDAEISVKFSPPTGILTQTEKEDSVIKRMKEGLIDEVEAIMELKEVPEDKAMEIYIARKLRAQRLEQMLVEEAQALGIELPPPPLPPAETQEPAIDENDAEAV